MVENLRVFCHVGFFLRMRDPLTEPNSKLTVHIQRRTEMHTILIVILILLLLGAFPAWPHSRNWGYAPSGGLGLIVIILVILLLLGRI